MKNERVKSYVFTVPIVNLQTLGAHCGTGRGKSLAEAQQDALRQAAIHYSGCNPRLSDSGYEVFVDVGINC
jgi:hypothetical protein